MPRSRRKNGNSTNLTAASVPLPLLDSIRAQTQLSSEEKNETESDINNFKVWTEGWQCNAEDWTDKKISNSNPNTFPQTIRSLERKTEQSKNKLVQLTQVISNTDDKKSDLKEQTDDRTKNLSKDINVSKLTLLVSDLITGQHDQSAYGDFLTILQHFSVHDIRDDQLEETIYHLIQAAVSFIRSNEKRFDLSKLEECYRQRHILKRNRSQ